MTTDSIIKLKYFNIDGVAECVRLALVLSGTQFEDVRVQFPDWPAMKPTVPNGQLPVMTFGEDESVVKTQSKAMLRWVGATKSSTLYPTDKLSDIEEVIGDIEDLQRAFMPAQYMGMRPTLFGYPADFQSTDEGKNLTKELRTKFVKEELPNYLKRLSDKINQHGGPYLVAGTEPTIADCYAIPILRSFTKGHMDHVDTKCLDANPTIVKYIQAFCANEAIKNRYTDGVH